MYCFAHCTRAYAFFWQPAVFSYIHLLLYLYMYFISFLLFVWKNITSFFFSFNYHNSLSQGQYAGTKEIDQIARYIKYRGLYLQLRIV